MALRYDARDPDSATYIESLSLLPWLSLGAPLQADITRALERLRQQFQI